jgi:hypothetical protein
MEGRIAMHLINSFVDSLDVSSRDRRRKAVGLVIKMLGKICAAETSYMERMPLNLQAGPAYAEADYSVDTIISVIVDLSDAY